MNNYKAILTRLIKDKSSWPALKTELSKFNVVGNHDTKKDSSAGGLFEVFCKYYFLASPLEEGKFKNVWLFGEVPLDIRNRLNLGSKDYGTDLVLQGEDDKLFVVQCKFKNDETSRLNWRADKIAHLFAVSPEADGYIVFTNAIDLDQVSKTRHDNFTFYNLAHLNDLDYGSFQAIYERLQGEAPSPRKLYDPLPHQKQAVSKCLEGFGNHDRGQLILPCGAGKTVTALWIKEGLKANLSLVLVPSLALLRQIKNEWAKQRKDFYQYMCVCSEADMGSDDTDAVITHCYEVDTRVTTSPDLILDFLKGNGSDKVIFSTYQSLDKIVEAIKGTFLRFDFTFCDEAHQTAGIGINKFGLIHCAEKIPSNKRLYATATPRVVSNTVKKQLGCSLDYAFDMNDVSTYGPEFFRMSFCEAIKADILVDYKIVVMGVRDKEIQEFIKKKRFVHSDLTLDQLAHNYALDLVMKKYGGKHALSFHSKVKWAKDFAERHGTLFKDTKAYSVCGKQPTSFRNLTLSTFERSSQAIVSNARCLTEGVDVPAIDLVYFCDPKNSKVDIVQASGRALRKKAGKTRGLIVVPVYHSEGEDLESAIDSSVFKNLISVIRSLCDHDERLKIAINALVKGKGGFSRRDSGSPSLIDEEEAIILDGFEDRLKEALFDQMIGKVSGDWDLMFLRLKSFLETNDRYPTKKDDERLLLWVTKQRSRYREKSLTQEEVDQLNSLKFIWEIQDWKWESKFLELCEYAKSNNFSPQKKQNPKLATWYYAQIQKLKNNQLSEERAKKLKSIRFVDFEVSAKDLRAYEALGEFRKENPNDWPIYDKSNRKAKESQMAKFCQKMRKLYRENNLPGFWESRLKDIGFDFEEKDEMWISNYEKASKSIFREQEVSIKAIGKENYDWITGQIELLGKNVLSNQQEKLLEALNLAQYATLWEVQFEKLKQLTEAYNSLPPRSHHPEIWAWLKDQDRRFRKQIMTAKQKERLKALGFDVEMRKEEWDKKEWLKKFKELKNFCKLNSRFPTAIDDRKLFLWCEEQRKRAGGSYDGCTPLSSLDVTLLDSIGFRW